MQRLLVAIGVLTALGAHPAWAQSADECVPSALNIPEAKYPCAYPDHRVLFRVVAPDAQKVRVRIGPGFDRTSLSRFVSVVANVCAPPIDKPASTSAVSAETAEASDEGTTRPT